MKKWIIIVVIIIVFPVGVRAAVIAKLPYAKGQSFVVTQGYDTPPTHIKKDAYALDLTQNGCDAYGKAVVAAASGKVMFLSQEGYNGGYGTELIIDHGGSIVSRYAHMIPDSIAVGANDVVRQGQTIGHVGDTGLVAGMACTYHPGTHLHFAMDVVAPDGTFSAYDPEPISGYIGMTVGKWYLSDNGDSDGDSGINAGVALLVASSSTSTLPLLPPPAITTTSIVLVSPSFTTAGVPAPSISVAPISVSVAIATATTTNNATNTSLTETTSTLFQQADDTTGGPYSFYDDNWYDLGNDFSGTLNTLTLEGRVSDPVYFASHVALQEFKDKDYTAMVQQFIISDDAPFTNITATTTFSGLSIVLKPYFYYRLATIQDYQNRSVILAGTATTTVGIAMAHNGVPGVGGVESTSTFFPFIVMEGIAATSTLAPPPLTSPGNIAEVFDGLTLQVALSWSTSTDPDWAGNPLHYQINYSTSTELFDSGWTTPDAFPVATGNSYLIGIRALDDYGDVSVAATATWNFPAGFTPYLLSRPLGYASQYFTVPSTSTLRSIQLFTANIQTNARYVEGVGCSLELFDEYDLSSLGVTPSDNGFAGYDCTGAPIFSFASSSPTLYPDHQYHWVFTTDTGNPSTGASVQFYGTAMDTAGGLFNDPSLTNAKFTVTGDTGVLFSN